MAIAMFAIILFFVAYEWWDENRGRVGQFVDDLAKQVTRLRERLRRQ